LKEILQQFNLAAVIDILLITFIIYHLLLLIRGTRAAQMLTGILIVILAFLISSTAQLTTLNWLMNKFYSSFIIILVILFQEDIRQVLSRMGKKSIISGADHYSSAHMIDEITRAASSLANKRIGALIVLERSIILSRYVDVGILLDSRISKELLVSIFHTSSPIHDGAVIIQRGRVAAAGCFLPLTREQDLDPNMGTRHRAAIGISQETDALVVLMSEEGGSISLVADGSITGNLTPKKLRELLIDLLVDNNSDSNKESAPPTGGPDGLRRFGQKLSSMWSNRS
jgi:diadenylate cyclase